MCYGDVHPDHYEKMQGGPVSAKWQILGQNGQSQTHGGFRVGKSAAAQWVDLDVQRDMGNERKKDHTEVGRKNVTFGFHATTLQPPWSCSTTSYIDAPTRVLD